MMTSCTCMWPWPGQLRHLVDSGASCSSIFPFQPFSPCIGLCLASHGPPVQCSCMLHFAPVKSNSPFLAKTSTRSPLSAELSHPSTLLYRWDSLRSSFLRFLLNSPSFLGPYGQTSFCPIDRQHHPPSKKRTGYRK